MEVAMNTKAMFEKKEILVAELEEILNVSEVENRSFNEAEQTKIAQLQEEIRAIDNKLQNKKVEEKEEVTNLDADLKSIKSWKRLNT